MRAELTQLICGPTGAWHPDARPRTRPKHTSLSAQGVREGEARGRRTAVSGSLTSTGWRPQQGCDQQLPGTQALAEKAQLHSRRDMFHGHWKKLAAKAQRFCKNTKSASISSRFEKNKKQEGKTQRHLAKVPPLSKPGGLAARSSEGGAHVWTPQPRGQRCSVCFISQNLPGPPVHLVTRDPSQTDKHSATHTMSHTCLHMEHAHA